MSFCPVGHIANGRPYWSPGCQAITRLTKCYKIKAKLYLDGEPDWIQYFFVGESAPWINDPCCMYDRRSDQPAHLVTPHCGEVWQAPRKFTDGSVPGLECCVPRYTLDELAGRAWLSPVLSHRTDLYIV